MPVEQGGLYLYRDLEMRLPRLLEPRRRELPFESGVDVPTEPDLVPGTYEVVQTVINDVGDARILADGSYDIPLVDATADEDRYRVLMIASGFSTSFQNERREAYVSNNGTLRLREYDTKMKTAIRAIQEKRNKVAAFGDSKVNFTGLLNNANVPVNNSSFDPYAVGSSASVVSDYFISLVQTFYSNSNNVWFPTTALVATSLYFRLISLVMPNGSITVKDHIEKALADDGIPFEIRRRIECNSAVLEANGVQSVGTNKDRILLYPLDPEVIERHIEMIQMAPAKYVTVQGLKTIYPMFGCTTPTIINFPQAFAYIDVPKAS